jgi:hypothetical protein
VALAAPGIQQAFDRVDEVLERWKQPHTLYYDDTDQRIKVHVRPGTDVRGVLAGVSVALPVDVIEDGMIVQTTGSIEGGQPSNTSTNNLTTGFAVIHEDKREGITTAGHAGNGSLTVKGYPIGFGGELYGAGMRDIQWHTATGHSYPPLVYIATNGGLLTIQAVNSLGEGVPVCMQGRINQNRCGRTVRLINNGYDNLNNRYENAVSVVRDDRSRMVSEGDSGAPMVTADYGIGRAHGVNFGGTNPITSTDFKTAYYVKSSDFYLLKLTIKTRPPY